MKKIILGLAVLFSSFSVNAQEGFYVSIAGGPTYKASEKVLSTSNGAFSGSYGEGVQAQLRGGYFFNEKLGVELGLGYLHGDKQVIREGYLTVDGKARAFGAALTGIYNISSNVYVKAGLLTKVGGKTVNKGTLDLPVPLKAINPAAPAGLNADLHVDFERDSKGKLPLGYIAAFGVKHKFKNCNWGIFAEMEYQGINVSPNKSTLTSYTASITTPEGIPNPNPNPTKEQLNVLGKGLIAMGSKAIKSEDLLSISDEFSYSDNPQEGQRQTFDVPYSSFGFNFGITYFFN